MVAAPNGQRVIPSTFRGRKTRHMTFRLQARELGTSKLMAVITVLDEKGKVLGRAGDGPLAEDLYNVNQSRTAGDPMLRVEVPQGINNVPLTATDLALRCCASYVYRLHPPPP